MKKLLIINLELYALTLWLLFHGAAGTIVLSFVSPRVPIPRPIILRRGKYHGKLSRKTFP
ncbi:MAG: hypothetical protein MJ109_07195 [Kiritimatiellae bacterium]|nr:hypothetical protein [Kiritimatiellia bacterium]